MKRMLSIAAVLVLIFSLCGCEAQDKYPEPTEKFFVNDFADVIEDTAENKFYSKAVALNKATTAQVVIVTVEDLGGETPADYALELGRKWGVGSEENNNGIVVLLSLNDREIYIAVGYGLEGALPDSKTGRIIDVYGLKHLRNDDFSTGLSAIGNALINEVYIEYGLEPESGYVNIDNVTVTQDEDAGSVAVAWIIMMVIILSLSLLSRRFGGTYMLLGLPIRVGYSGGRHRGGHGGFGSFGGGSFGGGGFSGGGGSFGGGGAGRGF